MQKSGRQHTEESEETAVNETGVKTDYQQKTEAILKGGQEKYHEKIRSKESYSFVIVWNDFLTRVFRQRTDYSPI